MCPVQLGGGGPSPGFSWSLPSHIGLLSPYFRSTLTVPIPYLSATQMSQSLPVECVTCPLTAPIPTWPQIRASFLTGLISPPNPQVSCLPTPQSTMQPHRLLSLLSPPLQATCSHSLLLSPGPGPAPWTLGQQSSRLTPHRSLHSSPAPPNSCPKVLGELESRKPWFNTSSAITSCMTLVQLPLWPSIYSKINSVSHPAHFRELL